MLKYLFLCMALALLLIPCSAPINTASADVLVSTSARFIQVQADAGSSSEETITLAATLYQPRFLTSAPAVVYIHGWGGHRLTGNDNLAYYIAASGYIVLSYTARGFGDGESGGRVELAGPNEINDLKRVIDWLVADPDNAVGPRVTKIGVIGGSYGGGHSFQISSDPRVSAVVPLVGWTDLEQALYPNGAINYKLGLAEFYGGLERSVGSPPFYNYDRLQFEMFDTGAEGRSPNDFIKQALRARSIAHQDDSGREVLDPARQPTAPTFIIQSWDDYLFPASQVMDVYSQIRAPKRIYLGRTGHPPGGHEYSGEEIYIGQQILEWFNHYLRGFGGAGSNSVASALAPVPAPLYSSSDLPTASGDTLALYLKKDGSLARKRKGKNAEEIAGGIFRPNLIRSSRLSAEIPPQSDMFSATTEQIGSVPRSLVYTYEPFLTGFELAGQSEYTLFVGSATSQTVDVIVRLFDVAPDGDETEVTVGVMRVEGLNTDEVRRVTFRDFGDHWIFLPGHRLRLKVTNIDFPDFRPPGGNDNEPSEITLRTGKAFPSVVRLPIRGN